MAAFNNCHLPNCIYQALTWPPICPNCHARYCYQHRNHPLHQCWVERQKGVWRGSTLEASNEPEVTQLLELLDLKLIKEEVESLRPGSKVLSIDKKSNSMEHIEAYKGEYNLQIKIDFEDGTSWMVRIRRKAGIRPYPDEPLRMNVQSEVATCQALSQGGVAVPATIPRPKDSNLHPKLIYCYQSFIEGSPWKDFTPSRPTNQPITESTRQHIANIAKWFLSLEQAEFDAIGSPTFSGTSDIIVGPLIERQPAMVVPPYFDGPFSNAKERYLSTINSRLNACRARTWVKPPRDVQMYLALLELRELVENDAEMGKEGRPFFIRHADDHWDHTRTRGEGEVTGVIDWEWAYTTTKAEAFSSPMYFLPDEFYQGKNDILSPSEQALIEAYKSLNRQDLADLVKGGRKYHRLTYFLKCMFINVDELNALKRAFLQIPDEVEEEWPRAEDEWVEGMMMKWGEDEGLKWLLGHPLEEPV